jgi:hypothetical protein
LPNINNLIKDIHDFLGNNEGWFTDEVAKTYSEEVTTRLRQSFSPREPIPRLRLSQMGPKCPRQLWYSIHAPHLAEPLPPSAVVKFTYGHLLEALVISWAKAAGHEVTGEQDELDVDGIKGHRDCVIDGCIVDVKSSSTLAFRKFKEGTIAQTDDFGYLDQLDGYLLGSRDDDLVRVKDRGYLLAVDKQLGHMCLYGHKLRSEHILERIKLYKSIVSLTTPPPCECGIIAEGESGNLKLDVRASYSDFKYVCFPHLRCFLYSKGPVFFTKVVKVPTYKGVPLIEVDKRSKLIYT